MLKPIEKSGYYTVASRSGSLFTFEGVKGQYLVLDDTLKVGDKIPVKMIKFYYEAVERSYELELTNH